MEQEQDRRGFDDRDGRREIREVYDRREDRDRRDKEASWRNARETEVERPREPRSEKGVRDFAALRDPDRTKKLEMDRQVYRDEHETRRVAPSAKDEINWRSAPRASGDRHPEGRSSDRDMRDLRNRGADREAGTRAEDFDRIPREIRIRGSDRTSGVEENDHRQYLSERDHDDREALYRPPRPVEREDRERSKLSTAIDRDRQSNFSQF